MPNLREDQARIVVQVDGVALDSTPWQSLEGGDIEASNTNTRPGGMEPTIDLGGPVARSDVTVKKLYSTDKLHPILLDLENACGGRKFTVSWTLLDGDKNPVGDTIVLTGILKGVVRPNFDANATAAAVLQLTAGMQQEAKRVGR